jgi:hypothetical protein
MDTPPITAHVHPLNLASLSHSRAPRDRLADFRSSISGAGVGLSDSRPSLFNSRLNARRSREFTQAIIVIVKRSGNGLSLGHKLMQQFIAEDAQGKR